MRINQSAIRKTRELLLQEVIKPDQHKDIQFFDKKHEENKRYPSVKVENCSEKSKTVCK